MTTMLEERMAAVEATVPHLATKADLYRVALTIVVAQTAVVGIAVGIILRFG